MIGLNELLFLFSITLLYWAVGCALLWKQANRKVIFYELFGGALIALLSWVGFRTLDSALELPAIYERAICLVIGLGITLYMLLIGKLFGEKGNRILTLLGALIPAFAGVGTISISFEHSAFGIFSLSAPLLFISPVAAVIGYNFPKKGERRLRYVFFASLILLFVILIAIAGLMLCFRVFPAAIRELLEIALFAGLCLALGLPLLGRRFFGCEGNRMLTFLGALIPFILIPIFLRSTDWFAILISCLLSPITAALLFELTRRPVEEARPLHPIFAKRMALPVMMLIAAAIFLTPIGIRKAMRGKLSIEIMPEGATVTAIRKDFYKKIKEYPFLEINRGKLAVKEEFKDRYKLDERMPFPFLYEYEIQPNREGYYDWYFPESGSRFGGGSDRWWGRKEWLSIKELEKHIKTVPHVAGKRVELKLPIGEYEIRVDAPNYFTKIFDIQIRNGTKLHKKVFLDKKIKWQFETDGVVRSIITADFTGGGLQEVVFTSQGGTVYCISDNSKPDSERRVDDGLHPTLLWEFKTEKDPSPPVVGDVNDDGRLEVVVGSGNKLYCLSGQDGTLVWQKEFKDSVGMPLLGDFDGDGLTDILTFGDRISWSSGSLGDFRVLGTGGRYLSGKDGQLIRPLPEITWYSPYVYDYEQNIALVDWNRDGISDILHTSWPKIHCISGVDGNILLEERGELPVVGDVDNDGFVDIVFISDNRIKCLSGKTGEFLEKWKEAQVNITDSPDARYPGTRLLLADMNHDGTLELFLNRQVRNELPEVVCLSGVDGKIIWPSSTPQEDVYVHGILWGVYDIDNDGFLDVITIKTWKRRFLPWSLIRCFSGRDAKLIWDFDSPYLEGEDKPFTPTNLAIKDLDSDGIVDILIATEENRLYCLQANTLQLAFPRILANQEG